MISVAMSSIELVELPIGLLLAGKQLNDRHSRDRFAEVGVDTRDSLANQTVCLARLNAEKVDGKSHWRDQRQ